jgi:hypothetical protein
MEILKEIRILFYESVILVQAFQLYCFKLPSHTLIYHPRYQFKKYSSNGSVTDNTGPTTAFSNNCQIVELSSGFSSQSLYLIVTLSVTNSIFGTCGRPEAPYRLYQACIVTNLSYPTAYSAPSKYLRSRLVQILVSLSLVLSVKKRLLLLRNLICRT